MTTPKRAERPNQFSVFSSGDELVEIVALRAEIKLWLDRPLNEYAEIFLEVFEWLLSPIREKLTWYQNYTMNRFSPTRPQVLSSPRTWLQRGRQDVARMLYLKGPDELKAPGQYVLHFKYHPDDALYSESNTPFLRVATPSQSIEKNPADYLKTTKHLCDLLPYLSGHVGYCLEISPYYESQAYGAAYPLAMRHPGTNIASDHATWPLRDEKGVETVNWLTLIGELPLAKLGGVEGLRKELRNSEHIEVLETRHGVIVKAGDAPQLGDVNRRDNLPLYREVYRALKPVLEPVIKDFSPLPVGGELSDEAAKTQRWLRRFE